MNMNLEEISMDEMKNALQQLKTSKPPGVDEIRPEVLKADNSFSQLVSAYLER